MTIAEDINGAFEAVKELGVVHLVDYVYQVSSGTYDPANGTSSVAQTTLSNLEVIAYEHRGAENEDVEGSATEEIKIVVKTSELTKIPDDQDQVNGLIGRAWSVFKWEVDPTNSVYFVTLRR